MTDEDGTTPGLADSNGGGIPDTTQPGEQVTNEIRNDDLEDERDRRAQVDGAFRRRDGGDTGGRRWSDDSGEMELADDDRQDLRPHIERVEIEIVTSGRFLDDGDWIREFIDRIVDDLDLTLFETVVHRFHPIGITAVGIIGESHVSVHTWPERGYAHVEILSCDRLPDDRSIADAVETDDVRVLEVTTDE